MRQTQRRETTRRTVLGAVGSVAAVGLAGCVGPSDDERETATVEHTLSADDVDELAVSVDDAETTVRQWDESTVRIEAEKYAIGQTKLSEVSVTREVSGGVLNVGGEYTSGIQFGVVGGGVERLDVRVPAGVEIGRVDGDDGRITVTNLSGTADIDVEDGDVTVDGVDGLRGEIDDGSIEAASPVRLGDVTGGDASVDLAVGGTDGDTTVECDDGRIVVRVAPGLDATIVAESDDGNVQFADGAVDSVESTGDDTLRGRVGAGGDRLRLAVDDGRIVVRPL
ncbi:hypothetical protein RYH80_15670 [Halobaculum sp. MBLA0147]|uniref:hypothetical protein n=1 Tax=Halobaculum sp. MBLA0147 TaxID=3079934 RepID=UPI0035252D40